MSLIDPYLRPYRVSLPTGIPWPPELDGTIPNAPQLNQVVHAVHSPIYWVVERNPNQAFPILDNTPVPWRLDITADFTTLPITGQTFQLLGVTYRFTATPTTITDIFIPPAATPESIQLQFINTVRTQLESIGVSFVIQSFGATSVYRVCPQTTTPLQGLAFNTTMTQFAWTYTPAIPINVLATIDSLFVYCRVFSRLTTEERNTLGSFAPAINLGEWVMLGLLKTPFNPDTSVFTFDVSKILRPYVSTDLPFIGQFDGTTLEPGLVFNTTAPFQHWRHENYLVRYALEFGLEYPDEQGALKRILQTPELRVGFPDGVDQQGLFAANAALPDDSRITFENTFRQYWLPQAPAPFRKDLLTQQPSYKRTHLGAYEMLSMLIDSYLTDIYGSFLSLQFRILLHNGGILTRTLPLGNINGHYGMVSSYAGLLSPTMLPTTAVAQSVKEYEAWFGLSQTNSYANAQRISLSQFYQLEFAVADTRYEYAQLIFMNRLGAYDTLPFGTVEMNNSSDYGVVQTERTTWGYLNPTQRRGFKRTSIPEFGQTGQIDELRQVISDRKTTVSFTSHILDRYSLDWIRQHLIGSPEVYLFGLDVLESAGSGLFRCVRRVIVEDIELDKTKSEPWGVLRLNGYLGLASPHINTN